MVVVKSGKGSLSEWWWGCPTLGSLGGTGPSDGGAIGRGTAMRLRGFATVWGPFEDLDGLVVFGCFWLDFWRKCHKSCWFFAGDEVGVVCVFVIIVVVTVYQTLISSRFFNVLRRLSTFHSFIKMDESRRPAAHRQRAIVVTPHEQGVVMHGLCHNLTASCKRRCGLRYECELECRYDLNGWFRSIG